MCKFSCIFFCIAVCIFIVIKEVNSQASVPKYKIDLDQEAETRWREIGYDFVAYSSTVLEIIRNRIPPTVLPLAEKVALYLDTLFDEPYPGELRGLAEAFNMTLPDVILFNIFYDITAYCTSIVAQNEQGEIFHARNLDYDYSNFLRNTTVDIDFLRNGKYRSEWYAAKWSGDGWQHRGVRGYNGSMLFTLDGGERLKNVSKNVFHDLCI